MSTHTDGLATIAERRGMSEADVERMLEELTPESQRYVDEYAHGHKRFGLWLHLVDRQLRRKVGLTHRDLVDWTWRDAFEDGLTPREAALEALENDDLFGAGLFD